MFANIYLNEVDQYVKNTLHCKYYFRYLDDSLAIFKTKEEAKKILMWTFWIYKVCKCEELIREVI